MPLVIPATEERTDVEQLWTDLEPPGLFPPDQDSWWGQRRKVYSDYLQQLADDFAAWYLNMDPNTVDDTDMANWEEELQIPQSPELLTLEQRRAHVLSRWARGPFTRTRRRALIESFIEATFGVATQFSPAGVPFDAGGITMYSGAQSLAGTYKVVENVSGFSYVVRLLNSVTVDITGLTRELTRITPDGISFTIVEVADPNLTGALTLSGNEVTDAVRAAAASWTTTKQGGMVDSAAIPGGIRVQRAATNLHPRGQCDSLSSWSTVGTGASISIDATTKPPFSSQSVKCVCDGTVINQGVWALGLTGQAAAVGTNGAAGIWFKGVAGQSYVVESGWANTDATFTGFNNAQKTIVATGAWQWVTGNSIAVAAGKTGDRFDIRIQTAGTRADTFWVAHPMIEKGFVIPAPYVATSGGVTATQPASRIQAPLSLLSAEQGWVAMRVRWGMDSSPLPTSQQYFFMLGDGSFAFNNAVYGWRWTGDGKIYIENAVAGALESVGFAPPAFSRDDEALLIFMWDAGHLYVSVNGAAFSSVARTKGIPSGMTTFDLGSALGTGQINSGIRWAACGTGTLTNADAATLSALGDTHPDVSTLPDAAEITGSMPMIDNTFDQYNDAD